MNLPLHLLPLGQGGVEAPASPLFDWHSAPPAWLFFLFILPGILLFVGWIYSREGGGAGSVTRVFLGGLRTLALLVLLWIVFDPFIELTAQRNLDSHVIVLYDGSQSMRDIEDNYELEESLRLAKALGLIEEDLPENLSRPEVAERFADELERFHPTFDRERILDAYPDRASIVNQLLGEADPVGIRERLAGRHTLVEYVFSTAERREVDDADGATAIDVPQLLSRDFEAGQLEGLGPETALRDAVRAAVANLGDKPIAGVIVVTDGVTNADKDTSVDAEETWARRLGVKVHTIGIGNPHPPKDLEVAGVEAEKYVFKDNKATILAQIEHTGFEGKEVEVHLELPAVEARDKADGEPLVQRLTLGPDKQRQTVVFHHTFKHKGRHQLAIRVQHLPKEHDYRNNIETFEVTVIDEKIRVLYIEGQPRWEYRNLRSAMVRDDKLSVNILLLDADPTFPQEKSPWAPEMNEVPSTPEALAEFKRDFHVVIFGDFAPTELDEARERFLKEMKNWVESEFFGGGFIMIAGQNSSPIAWVGTDIEKMLPIEIEDNPPPEPRSYDRVYQPKLTPLGWNHPITRLDPDAEENRRVWTDAEFGLPGLFWYKRVRRAKAGAMVLVTHPEVTYETERGEEPMPLVAFGRYGHGQTMWVGLDETWRWRFLIGDKWFWRFWKQAIFFMAKRRLLQSDSRWRIWTEKTEYQVGQRIVVHAEVRDSASEPSREEVQTIHYQVEWGEDGAVRQTEDRTLVLSAVPDKPGQYQGTLNLFRAGTYAFWFWAKGEKDVAPTEKGRHSIEVAATTFETRNTSQDVETLRRIARASGGVYLPIHDLADLPEIEPRTRQETVERSEKSLWHNGLIYAILVGLLVLEWIFRKMNRML